MPPTVLAPLLSPPLAVFDRLTDPRHYTGAHRHRFDESGRGMGIDGRVEVHDTRQGRPRGEGLLLAAHLLVPTPRALQRGSYPWRHRRRSEPNVSRSLDHERSTHTSDRCSHSVLPCLVQNAP